MSLVSSDGGDGNGPGLRRLIVFNPNRILNTTSGPIALEELEETLRKRSPKFCFLSGSSPENPTRKTFDEMRKAIPDLDRTCTLVKVDSERIPMAVSYLEILLEEHLSGVSDLQCMTIMVMTISPEPDFRRFVRYLVGAHDRDLKLSNKALAVLESKEPSRGWSEAQDLQEAGWNLVNRVVDDVYPDAGRGDDYGSYSSPSYKAASYSDSYYDSYYLQVRDARKEGKSGGGGVAAAAAAKFDKVHVSTLDYLRSRLGKPARGEPDNADYWAKAVREEDCVRLKDLVEEARQEYDNLGAEDGVRRRELLKKLSNEYREKSDGTIDWQKISKGYTAVHAAAKRGDLKFLEFIVNDILHGDGYCSIQCNVLKLRHSAYKLDALAMAVANGNQKIINFLIHTSRECDYNPYDVKVAFDDGSADSVPREEDGESTVGPPKELGGESTAGLTKEPPHCEKNAESMAGLTREPAPREKDGESTVRQSGVNVSDQLEGNLQDITKLVLSEKRSSLAGPLYYRDKDFNFLDINMYLFHFTFSTWEERYAAVMLRIREGIFSRISRDFNEKELLKYLLLLKDGQGRTPLHAAVDSNRVKEFRDLLPSQNKDKDLYKLSQDKGEDLYKLIKDILNAQDDAGRTPLYRAAAKNQEVAVKELLEDDRVNLNAKMVFRAGEGGVYFDADQLSLRNSLSGDCLYIREKEPRNKSYKKSNAQDGRDPKLLLPEVSSSALHIAIILKHEEIVEAIVNKLLLLDNHDSADMWCQRRLPGLRVAGNARENADISIYDSRISTMKLGVLVESIPILQTLLKAEDKKPGLFTSLEDERKLPSFHLAAAMGNVEVVKAFLDSKEGDFDPTRVDCFHNTALHHALQGTSATVYPHLVDFVGCDYIPDWRSAYDDDAQQYYNPEKLPIAVLKSRLRDNQRQLCIDLLLQVGVSIWEKNVLGRTAKPDPSVSNHGIRTLWWYARTTDEVTRAYTKLNAAANGISVTAALVATASYVGPFQPPLGYGTGSIYENILAVRIYVTCNSLSFYLALGAIMLALLPALPLPQESVFRELARIRILIAAAVTFLFPSIVCVLLAFASGYIAVSADHGLAYDGFLVATTAVGGLLCFLVMAAFLHRLTKVIVTLPRDVWKESGLRRSARALVGLFRWILRSSSRF